mgnify:FL=1
MMFMTFSVIPLSIMEISLQEFVWYPTNLNSFGEYVYSVLGLLIFICVAKPEWNDIVKSSRRYDKS